MEKNELILHFYQFNKSIESIGNEIKEEILNYLENTENKNFYKNKQFILVLIKKYGIDQVLEWVQLNILEKQITYLRHGLAEHNLYNRNKHLFSNKPVFFDPALVEEGKTKIYFIKEEMIKNKMSFELVFVSPLRRTIETLLILKEKEIEKGKEIKINNPNSRKINSLENKINEEHSLFLEHGKFYCTDLIREKFSNTNTHIGKPLIKLKEEENSKDLDFSYFKKHFWWADSDDNEIKEILEKESDDNFISRLIIFILCLCLFQQKKILIISHSKVGKFFLKQKETVKISQEIFHEIKSDELVNMIKTYFISIINF